MKGTNKKSVMIPAIPRCIAFLLLMILLSQAAFALGVTPASKNLNYEPDRSQTLTLTVRNDEGRAMDAHVHVKGALKEYITLEKESLSFTAAETEKTLSYTIDMPASVEEPGVHSTDIIITEKTEEEGGEIALKPNMEVVHMLHCHVPYPQTYAEARMKSSISKDGEPVRIAIPIFNLGENALKDVWVQLTVTDPSGDTVKELKTEPRPLSSKKAGEITLEIPVDGLSGGIYYVKAILHYDDKTLDLTTNFMVEQFLLKLLSIMADEYNEGGIARIKMLIQNEGNKELDDVGSRITIRDMTGSLIDSIKGYKLALNPEETKETSAYWDTSDIKLGRYKGQVVLSYGTESNERNISMDLGKEKLEINLLTGKVISEEQPQKAPENVPWHYGIIGLLIAMIGFLAFKAYGKGRNR